MTKPLPERTDPEPAYPELRHFPKQRYRDSFFNERDLPPLKAPTTNSSDFIRCNRNIEQLELITFEAGGQDRLGINEVIVTAFEAIVTDWDTNRRRRVLPRYLRYDTRDPITVYAETISALVGDAIAAHRWHQPLLERRVAMFLERAKEAVSFRSSGIDVRFDVLEALVELLERLLVVLSRRPPFEEASL